ncbi:hypothetical protein DTO013E5_3540 [Penicillium roqueforti]|uniref:Genomic scaffold, ProqFM164S02 n=1 Tax=Penicillium roqueforti (strain FM164) TaxID=1365484 RepID=W6Q7E3_PENRF|nr:uncharacterized protein LCP9604111_6782 [Penicillium roqueforti]CDM32260.1 unnamed protein product [Penicillium roqueforti FM164]KAF9245464.1 hypothetical protein LCP9604111_6782 [Penicillium roqueforti]KAI1832866.1 hypothetical protein CBS147337_6277 [Penicillium roqueforti]KAI2723995.1 hypothetical protein CBS147318_926 [Penicillium roqueforti]KAI2742532.1 hypothetical protein DTO012A1_3833 [Penicillium roqueforti]
METTNYLSLPAIAEFINAYEANPTAENVKIMVSALLTYAFDSNDGWVLKWQEDEENNHSNCFVVKASGDERSLHTIVKVVLDTSVSVQADWDQFVPRLLSAPLPDERCWAILIRGYKVRLYEYHRDQELPYRLIPCDFKVKDKLKHTVHIHKNPDAVNNILMSIPNQVPKPLGEGEQANPSPPVSVAETTGSEASPNATPETVRASGVDIESSSEDLTDTSGIKTPTEAEPVTEPEAIPQTKTATQVDSTTSQTKHTTANGTKAKVTPQAKVIPQAKATPPVKITPEVKAALLAKAAAKAKSATPVKPAAGVKTATPSKTASQVKSAAEFKSAAQAKNAAQVKSAAQAKAAILAKAVSGMKITPKVKPAKEIEVVAQTATN